MDRNIYRNRREILQAASLSSLALAGAGAAHAEVEDAPADDVNCNEEPSGGQRVRPTPEELQQAKEALWESFYEGVLAWGGNTKEDITFEDGLKDEKDAVHSAILTRKWRLWNKCSNQTRHCAFMAGLLIEGIRRHEHPEHSSPFNKPQFDTAVQMVQTYQRSSLGASFIGIVC